MAVAADLTRWAAEHARTVGCTPAPVVGVDLGTFRRIGTVPCGDRDVFALAVATAPDGRVLLATSNADHSISVRDVLNWGSPVVLCGHTARINAICWREPAAVPGGLASCGHDGTVRLWSADGGPGRQLPIAPAGPVLTVAWTRSPGGPDLLAMAGDGWVETWDTGAGVRVGRTTTDHGQTWAARWAASGRALVTGGYDGVIRVWDPDLGRVWALPGEGGPIGDVALLPGVDGMVRAVATCARSIDVWDVQLTRRLRTLAGGDLGAQAVGCHRLADGRLVAATNGFGSTLRVWNVDTGALLAELEHPDRVLDSVGFATLPDGRLLLAVACGDRQAYLWATDPPAPDASRAGGERSASSTGLRFGLNREFRSGARTPALCLGLASDVRALVAAAGSDGRVTTWDVASGESLLSFAAHDHPIASADVIRHDGALLLATGAEAGGVVRIWEAETGTLRHMLEGPASAVTRLLWTHDQQGRALLVGTDDDGTAWVWDGATGRMLRTLRPVVHASWIVAPRQGVLLATTSPTGDIQIRDPGSWRCVYELVDRSGVVTAGGSRPDGSPLLAVVRERRSTAIWDLGLGAVTSTVDDEGGRVLAWHALPDGRPLLLTAGREESVRVWDAQSGVCLATLPHTGSVRSIAAVTVGDRLVAATACDDGAVRVWSADLTSLPPPPGPGRPSVERGRRPVALAEAVLLGAAGVWRPLGLTSDLVTLTGTEMVSGLFDPRLRVLAEHPGILRLRRLNWPARARASFAALLTVSQRVPARFTPPRGSESPDHLHALRDATGEAGARPAPTEVDVGALQRAADGVSPGVVTLLRVIGPDAAADEPLLPLRLLHRAPDLPDLTATQFSLLGSPGSRILRRHSVGASTMRAAGTAGITRRGSPTSLLLTQLALTDDVFDARYAAGDLLHRHHPAGSTPRPMPVTIVLDTTPPTFGPAEGLLRLMAHLMTRVLWVRGVRPLLVTLSAPDGVRELTQPADLLEIWTSRTLDAPDLSAALDTAAAASRNPTVTLTVHHRASQHPTTGSERRLVTTHQPGRPPRDLLLGRQHHHLPPDPTPVELAAVLTSLLSD